MSEQDSKPNSDPDSSMTSSHDSDLAKSQPETTQASSGLPSPIDPVEGQSPSIIAYQWNAPLPTPGLLEQFDAIVPGSAKRIIDQAEREQTHRHKMEEKELQAFIDHKSGQRFERLISHLFAFVTVAGLISLGTWLTANGHPKVGASFVVPTVLGVLMIWVLKQSPSNRPNKESTKDDSKEDLESTP